MNPKNISDSGFVEVFAYDTVGIPVSRLIEFLAGPVAHAREYLDSIRNSENRVIASEAIFGLQETEGGPASNTMAYFHFLKVAATNLLCRLITIHKELQPPDTIRAMEVMMELNNALGYVEGWKERP